MKLLNRIKIKLNFILSCHYKIARVFSFKRYSDAWNNVKYIPLFTDRTTTVYPIHFFNDPPRIPLVRRMSDVYYAKIKNCSIIGRSNVIFLGKHYLLHDDLDNATKPYVNVTDAGIFFLFNRAIHFGKYYVLNFLGTSGFIIDRAIILSGNFSNNYYHFILEYLVKFSLIESANIDKTIPIILDKHVIEIPQFNELISIFNEDKREIIYVDKQILYKINELHYFSFINEIPPNIKNKIQSIKSDYFSFDFKSIDYLRSIFFRNYYVINPQTDCERIYLSRKISNRRNVNEEEILPLLKKYKFQVCCPEQMTVKEQFLLFNNAKYIIAPSGAALTNIIFCMPMTDILVLQGIRADVTIFSSIAEYLNINMQYITADNKYEHSNFKVPINLVEDYLKTTFCNEI